MSRLRVEWIRDDTPTGEMGAPFLMWRLAVEKMMSHEMRAVQFERDALAATLQRVRDLANEWRYKGEFGWGAWQEGNGPDEEGWVLDGAATELLAITDASD